MKGLFSHFLTFRYSRNWGYVFVFGFLLFLTIFIQIFTGFFLSCKINNYVNIISVLHSVVASFIVIFLYIHIYKNFYYRVDIGYNERFSFLSGIVAFIFLFSVCFTGYVIPWGQISFWGTKVITSYLDLIPVLGPKLKEGLWGSISMSEVITMKRFLSLHIILGCFSWVSIFLHIYIVHSKKSITVPLSCFEDTFKTSYLYPDAYLKDFFVSTIIFLFLTLYVNLDLNFFEEFLNNCPITFDQTPFNMSPEWYFLPSFSVLKYVDNKIFGVIISSLFIFSIFVVLYFFEDDDNFF